MLQSLSRTAQRWCKTTFRPSRPLCDLQRNRRGREPLLQGRKESDYEAGLNQSLSIDYSDLHDFSSEETKPIIAERREETVKKNEKRREARSIPQKQREKQEGALETLRKAIDTSLNQPETLYWGLLSKKCEVKRNSLTSRSNL